MVHKLEKSGSIEEYYRCLAKLIQHAPQHSLANQDYSFDSEVSDPGLSPWETKSLHCLLLIATSEGVYLSAILLTRIHPVFTVNKTTIYAVNYHRII